MLTFTRLALVASILPFVAATGCGKNQFLYRNRNVCISFGGHSSNDAGTPPAGVSCPGSKGDWWWSKGSKCCNPGKDDYDDEPSCPNGYTFNKSGSACIKTPPAPPKPGQCESGKFWWSDRNCCLTEGGPPSPPQPPSGTKCPPAWSWSSNKGCCIPHHPPTPNKPPTCPGGWDWCNDIKQCQPHPPKPDHPQPSGHPRRALKSRSDGPCREGLTACPIPTALGFADFECIDTRTEPESCGGCASTGEGKDCAAEIPNAFSVGCVKSTCVLHKCKDGFSKSADGKSCVADVHAAARRDF